MDNITRYTYTDGDERYVVTFTRLTDLTANKFIDRLSGPKKVAAKLAGFDGKIDVHAHYVPEVCAGVSRITAGRWT